MRITKSQLKKIIIESLNLSEDADGGREAGKKNPPIDYAASAKISGNKIKLTVTVGRIKNKSIDLELKDPAKDDNAYNKTDVAESIADAIDVAIPLQIKDKIVSRAQRQLKDVAGTHFLSKNEPKLVPDSYKEFKWDEQIRPGGSGWVESSWESFIDKAKAAGRLNGKEAMAAKKNWGKQAKRLGYSGGASGAKSFFKKVKAGSHKKVDDSKFTDIPDYKSGSFK